MARKNSTCVKKRSEGGRRKSGKTRKQSTWTKKVTALYHDMKRKDKNTTFMMALKEASRRKKAGKL
jgi:hypothetical protein